MRIRRNNDKVFLTYVLHFLPTQIFFPIVKSTSLEEQFQQRDWLLGAVSVNHWHVHVVDEYDQTFTRWWSKCVFGSLLNDRLDVPLNVQRRCSG